MTTGFIGSAKRTRTLLTIAIVTVVMMIVSACGNNTNSSQGQISEDKFNVVTSFYPIYEFTKTIGGDDVNVINLLPTGVEPHDWTPRSQDIVNTSKAGLFLYNGAGLEAWVPNFLKGLNKDSNVKAVEVSHGINLIDSDGESEDHAHEGEDHADDGHNHGSVDPHTWVSPKSALVMAENIKNSLVEADPEHKAGYEERYNGLKQQLDELDAKFTEQLSSVSKNEIVVSHQAFGYLTRDYGLTQHSIMGLSPDAEPRGQDIVKLANLVKEEGIRYIFFEELVSDKLAKTLASEAGVETMVLNPVEGLTEEQLQNGENYFTLMEKNLQNLVTALQ
ncbi:zinc ABC transporter substrate-binding protein [Paenibacillus sp. Marseille-Q4541]|uniref:metal ABC transporter solute-binding protein, Zn/Mn family n=1 Tax=Paenibacillus sp. Marseille-Q4541 TaxID=2831522 RepID=UPI001BA53062|nr:zinc ABC transporter substrate-binding protein [Paenibacillus sp. Marseille-Q4541]